MKRAICLAITLMFVFTAFAEVPREINFQGKLVLGGSLATGTHDMLFKIYDDETSMIELWSENHNATNAVEVTNGLFNVILGQITVFPPTMDFSEEYWIGISVDGAPEMAPRYKLITSPYAFRAIYSDTATFAISATCSGDFIQNQNTTIQNADFAIDGIGEVGIIHLNPGTPDVDTPEAGMIRAFGFGEEFGLYVYDGTCWREIIIDTTCYEFGQFSKIYISERQNNRIVRIDDMTGAGWVSYGSLGSGVDEFNQPLGIAIGPDNKIYVNDQHNSRLVRINDMTGTGWVSYGSNGSGIGQFHWPGHIAFTTTGKIIIGDGYNGRIVQIDNMTGTGWTSLGGFSQPEGVAVGPDGKIYIADASADMIIRVDDISGTGWVTFGSSGAGIGEFNYPPGIAVGSDNKIYIADHNNNRIVRIDDMTGTGWVSYGTYGSGIGELNNPQGISVGPDGKIYIPDTNNNRIVRIDDMTGTGWVSFGTSGSGVGEFNQPMGITFGP